MQGNNVTVVGNLTRDIELKFGASGVAFANVSVAFNTRKRNDKGEWEDGEASFFDGTLFRELAEHAAESLSKGQRVILVGHLEMQKWVTKPEDGSEGEPRTRVSIIVDSIGPDLRFATATVVKTERKNANGGEAPDVEDF